MPVCSRARVSEWWPLIGREAVGSEVRREQPVIRSMGMGEKGRLDDILEGLSHVSLTRTHTPAHAHARKRQGTHATT